MYVIDLVIMDYQLIMMKVKLYSFFSVKKKLTSSQHKMQ